MRYCVQFVFAVVAAIVASPAVAAEKQAPSSADPVQAIWQQQEISFSYQSVTTFYSCSSLETKIRRILLAVGANPGIKFRMRGCFSRHEIARYPYVEITLVSPVEATPEALAERDKTRSTRELAARVRGQTEAAKEAEKEFPAMWKQVSLSRGKLYLEPGDCELVEQLSEKVFPKLGIRVIEDDVRCTPNQVSMNQPRLVVEALVPVPKPDEKSN